MDVIIRRSTDTETGISVVKSGDRIDTFNVVGDKTHSIDSTYLQHGIFTMRWFGNVFDAEIKEILGGHALDAIIASKCNKILVDSSQFKTSWDGVNDWVRDVLMPRLFGVGLRCLAVVVSPDGGDDANKYAVERFENENQNTNGSFTSVQRAVEWLRAHG